VNSSAIYEFRIFIIEQDQRVLIATYLTTTSLPTVGTVLNIQMFKEEEGYPDQVRVLRLEETLSDEPSIVDQTEIFDVIVEPA
jgi:hypothetical protein